MLLFIKPSFVNELNWPRETSWPLRFLPPPRPSCASSSSSASFSPPVAHRFFPSVASSRRRDGSFAGSATFKPPRGTCRCAPRTSSRIPSFVNVHAHLANARALPAWNRHRGQGWSSREEGGFRRWQERTANAEEGEALEFCPLSPSANNGKEEGRGRWRWVEEVAGDDKLTGEGCDEATSRRRSNY